MRLGLSFVLLMELGCAATRPSIRSIWQQVPSVRWTNKSTDANEVTVQKEPASEPAVAANVAIKPDPVSESISSNDWSKEKKRKLSFVRPEERAAHAEALPQEEGSIAGGNDADKSNSETFAEPPRADSSMERLAAALTDDGPQSSALPQRSLTDLDDRIRVDSLLSRAKQLFEIGQLDQAHQVAQSAQELGETTQMDYSPDEERPIDLVRRIEGQLEATRAGDEPNPAGELTESPAVPAESEAINADANLVMKADQPSPAAGKEAAGAARRRRDWSNLFRREKKPTGSESDVATLNRKTLKPISTSGTRQREEPVTRPAESSERDAIVTANRSVSLGTPESMTTSPTSFESDLAEDVSLNRGGASSDLQEVSEVENQVPRDRRGTSATMIADSPRQVVDTDEGIIVPPDFEVIESTAPARHVNSVTNDRSRAELTDPDDVPPTDWTYYYLAFAMCSLLAVGCYRRRAT